MLRILDPCVAGGGTEDVPSKAGAWIEALAMTHAAAETVKPVSMAGKQARVR
jgi:hypothetical protein